eukprot:scaffold37760_cov72-Phaeocystis_antarctica.AAC.3
MVCARRVHGVRMACAWHLSTLLARSEGVLERPKPATVQHLVAFEQSRCHRAVVCLRLRLHTLAGRCRCLCRACADLADLVLESKEAELERVRLRHRSCRLIHRRPTRGDPRGICGSRQGGDEWGRERRHGARAWRSLRGGSERNAT